ncbi:MAG: Holliday junction resolvase RuvX [Bacteroidota bacterium]
MGRVLAFDYGTKRVGMAVTDPLGLIATGLCTLQVHEVFPFLKKYVVSENVDTFVVGEPKQADNTPSDTAGAVEKFVARLKKEYPLISVNRIDERFTSVIAKRTMLDSGLKKKDRTDKALVDEISAVLILQSWMETR